MEEKKEKVGEGKLSFKNYIFKKLQNSKMTSRTPKNKNSET